MFIYSVPVADNIIMKMKKMMSVRWAAGILGKPQVIKFYTLLLPSYHDFCRRRRGGVKCHQERQKTTLLQLPANETVCRMVISLIYFQFKWSSIMDRLLLVLLLFPANLSNWIDRWWGNRSCFGNRKFPYCSIVSEFETVACPLQWQYMATNV